MTTLAPGASTACTAAAHSIAQSDVDAGAVTNTATASALSPSGSTVTSNASSTNTPVAQTGSLLLTKSASVTDIDGDFKIDLGDKVQWSFLVKNTGSVTLSTVVGQRPDRWHRDCPATPLAPGASHLLRGDHRTRSPRPTWMPARQQHRHGQRQEPERGDDHVQQLLDIDTRSPRRRPWR